MHKMLYRKTLKTNKNLDSKRWTHQDNSGRLLL